MECLVFSQVKEEIFKKEKIKKLVNLIFGKLKKNGLLSVHLVGEKRIKYLNKVYRGYDLVTDVLSFATEDNVFFKKAERDFGDIFICQKQIIKQARELKINVEEEMFRMMVHGILHLLGHDHLKKEEAKKMFVTQEKLLKELL
ncbi:MAG: putative rRNA maturation factor [Candidatus Magasanikbacteria bacterium GW2011_GWC2_37_14]|uniref:Endoribonuclease YbeY n=1 Tax=Candidatus Magasanikbacteria bacterium GW2011_GWC2_37_14 TaxID=1619046 RepID=A0A0G0JHR9_9BACT|nr:MAG: putative rRNA maturation factor [Candidatus Magasanikbacteria bacterium GW2011_GWC2_37_14]